MHYYRTLPDGVEMIRAWTIYELVDDWLLRSTMKPGKQIVLSLLTIAGIAGLMTWITLQTTTFPALSIGGYVAIQFMLLFLTIVIHELSHALLILYYGGKPRFGAKWLKNLGPVVYATTNGFFSVHAYRRIAAAPLIIITGLCFTGIFFGIGWWLIVPFIFNAIGAGGDLLSLRVLNRYPSFYLIEDTQDGFTTYGVFTYDRDQH